MLNRRLLEAKAKGESWAVFAMSVALIVALFIFLAATTAGNSGILPAVGGACNKDARCASKTETESALTQAPSIATPSDSAVPKKLTATSSKPVAAEQAGAPSRADATTDGANGAETVVGQASTQAATNPASYVWTCAKDYGGIAPEDGSLSEWAPHYYIAHSYGPYGEAILQLEPGDVVTVNGTEVTVQGAVDMRKSCTYQEVMSAVGWDATVFQTCVPNSDQNRFVYARGVCSTEQAAQEARRWGGVDAGVRPSMSGQEVPRGSQTIVGPGVQPAPQADSEPQAQDHPEQPEASGRGSVVNQRDNSPDGAFRS